MYGIGLGGGAPKRVFKEPSNENKEQHQNIHPKSLERNELISKIILAFRVLKVNLRKYNGSVHLKGTMRNDQTMLT